jgi:hypothetical protein
VFEKPQLIGAVLGALRGETLHFAPDRRVRAKPEVANDEGFD